jgi:hypothetical protein
MTDDSPANLLLSDVEYQCQTTRLGNWRRFLYPDGRLFEEFVSHRQLFGWPLLHYTYGKNPETGKRVVAKGVVAVGRLAVGLLAVGQASAGVLAVGQLAIGVLLGLGQACTGFFALGQLAVASIFAVGQFAIGYTAIGQIGLGKYVLAQFGIGEFVWDTRDAAPRAVRFFHALLP